jgi:hypothetical protein
MPVGRYIVQDGDGRPVGTEEFRCAPGPAGWRYVATIVTIDPEPHREVVDYVVDDGWRPVRVRIDSGEHQLILSVAGDRLSGHHDGEPIEVPFGPEVEIDYLSPCFNAVTARRLDRTDEIEVVYLKPVTIEPITARQRYERGAEEDVDTPAGRFRAKKWQYTSLDSGWSRPFWLAGDVVVRFQDLFDLEEYEPGASGPAPER